MRAVVTATRRVIAVVGPTAAGKSALAISVARAVGGEVVNADSMQLYRGMDIGTAKLAAGDRAGVPHHLLDVLEVTEPSTAAAYQALCREVVDGLLDRGVTPVVVGGSGLYLRAALDRLEFPATDPVLRAELEADLTVHGPDVLHARLAALDPGAALRMEPSNGRRIVRALEVVTLTGSMPGALTSYDGYYDTRYVGLDRADLGERIEARVDRMWSAGLVAEVLALERSGLRRGVTASRALGYRQVLDMLDPPAGGAAVGGAGSPDVEARTRALIIQATRRFARRQRAWFRRDHRICWVPEDATAEAVLRLVADPD